MDHIIINDLYACVNCLGSLDQGKFVKDVDTNVSIRDILRHLRRESNKCEIRLELSQLNLIEKCLIPLFLNSKDDSTLFDLLLRLMMNLTQPAFICFKQQIPDDMLMRGLFIKVDESLQKYKVLFANHKLLEILASCLTDIFAKAWEDRSEEENMHVERVLILMRNVLHINTNKAVDETIDGSWSKHDRLLAAVLESGWTEVLAYLANSDNEHRFAFHTLEIITLMFKEQTPETINCSSKKSSSCKEEDNDYLYQLSKQEEELKNNTRAKLNIRGLRYDGVFELTNVKSPSGLPMIYHHDLSSGDIDLSRDRHLRRKARNRRPVIEKTCERKSPKLILEKLQDFCKLFLEFSYGSLMNTARNYLVRDQMQPDDETYYLWSLKFFTSVCRVNDLAPEFVSETMTHEVFHWVYEQIVKYMENGESDKKRARGWYRKMQLGVSAYNEMLKFLLMLDKHKDEKYRLHSVHIKSSVFYQEEYMDMYPMLLNKYKEVVQSRSILQELIEGSYLVIRILSNHKSFNMNVVRKLKKKKKFNKKKVPKAASENKEILIPGDNEEELDAIWNRISDVVTAVVKELSQQTDEQDIPCIYDATIPDGREPIEPGSEPIDIQLKRALAIVQIYMRLEKVQLAVSVLRLARSMWPDEDRIALSDNEDHWIQEISMLKTLLMTPKFYDEDDVNKVRNSGAQIEKVDEKEEEEEEEYGEEEEYNEEEYVAEEVLFDLNQYILKFTEPNIVKLYGILFKEFSCNPPSTNSSLLRIMHHIAVKMKLPIVLYNLRLFRSFSHFLKNPLSKIDRFKEERKFVLYLLKHFEKDVAENQKLFLEILFPKNPKHLNHILKGEKCEVVTQKWTKSLDEELERLFEELKEEEPLPGCDVLSMIENRFSDPSKTRRQIMCRMINLGLTDSSKDISRKSISRRKTEAPWRAEEQARLIVLVEEYKDQPNAMKFIMNGMKAAIIEPSDARSRRAIVKKILELGLVTDKAELGIKDRPKKKVHLSTESGTSEDESDKDDEEERDMDDNAVIHRVNKVPPPLIIRKIVDWTAFKMTFARLEKNERSWFLEMLIDNIDSRKDGIIGSLALIPLLDEDSQALSCVLMQKLLGICNFLPPDSVNDQSFWRIPEDMGAKELDHFRNCAASLSDADLEALTMTVGQEEAGTQITVAQEQTVLEENVSNFKGLFGSDSEEEEDEDNSISMNRREERMSTGEDEEEVAKVSRRNKRRILDDSDSDDELNASRSKVTRVIDEDSQ